MTENVALAERERRNDGCTRNHTLAPTSSQRDGSGRVAKQCGELPKLGAVGWSVWLGHTPKPMIPSLLHPSLWRAALIPPLEILPNRVSLVKRQSVPAIVIEPRAASVNVLPIEPWARCSPDRDLVDGMSDVILSPSAQCVPNDKSSATAP